MFGKKKVFRTTALERLSSPEQLDQIMQVTSPWGWAAISGIAILFITALLWGILGSIPTNISGMGIFIKGEGLKDISSPTSGQVTALYVSSGEMLKRGEMVARVARPDLIAEISQKRKVIKEHDLEIERIKNASQKQLSLQKTLDAKKTASINKEILSMEEQIDWLEKRSENQKQLLEKGLITKNTYISTKEEINSVKQRILNLENSRQQIPVEFHNIKTQQETNIRNREIQKQDALRSLKLLEQKLEESSRVFSPYSGRIIEITTTEGSLISSGSKIASLEPAGSATDDLKIVLYLPASKGKRVKPGMKASISPATVEAEEFGVMPGIITHSGKFPATQEGMMKILRNKNLVNSFSGQGAPIEVLVSPIPSPDTFSGYKWTSSKGPALKIYSGTLAAGSITIKEQAPLSLVLPWLKKNILGFGLEDNIK